MTSNNALNSFATAQYINVRSGNSMDGKDGGYTEQGACPNILTRRVLSGFNKYLKKVVEDIKITFFKSELTRRKHRQAKPYRRGFYTFLYGGRVDKHTFYDYMSD